MGIDIGRNKNPHRDIEGADIVAIADGTVTAVFCDHESKGNTVHMEHGGGFASRYMHNQVNMVTRGQEVRQGEIIALVGNTGRSYGPHLHLELLYKGVHVDPLDFVCPNRCKLYAQGEAEESLSLVKYGLDERFEYRPPSLIDRILWRLFAGRMAVSRD